MRVYTEIYENIPCISEYKLLYLNINDIFKQVEKNMYENLLTSNLFKRRDQLLQNIDELGMSERKQEYDTKKVEFDQATATMENTKKRYVTGNRLYLLEGSCC